MLANPVATGRAGQLEVMRERVMGHDAEVDKTRRLELPRGFWLCMR